MYIRQTLRALLLTACLTLTLAACGASRPAGSGSDAAGSPSPGESHDRMPLTLYADFSAGSTEDHEQFLRRKEVSLPMKDERAAPVLVAAYLAEELSDWTGLDFALNGVTFGGDGVTVDWAKESTLVTGLGDREQKEEFFFSDAVSLNWFMLDSLAKTLLNNLPVSAVYYCSEGKPIPFPNPEEMAAQGLAELPVDLPYEGSAFFVSHAGARGDLPEDGSID